MPRYEEGESGRSKKLLTGETQNWCELASHLKKTLFETKRFTSSSDFVLWLEYLDQKRKEEIETHKKLDWYLAQVAHEVYRANTQVDVDRRNASKVEQFLIEFHLQPINAVDEDKQKEKERRNQMMNAKLFFCCLTGVGMEALPNASEEQNNNTSSKS